MAPSTPNIQERDIKVNEYKRDEFVVRLAKHLAPGPKENETELERLTREARGAPYLVVNEKQAMELKERFEMKEGDVQWFTPRRRIPFGPPQRFMVPKDSKIQLEQDRQPEDYTGLPIPPDPDSEKEKSKKASSGA